jgi:glycosyltransferase involved in cell wall biosynthesis
VPRVSLLISDLARAGAETQLVELALGLDRGRWDVEIVLLKSRNDFGEPLTRAGIPVQALGRRGPLDLGALRRLARHLRGRRPDVLHASLFLANLHAVVATRRCAVPALVLSVRSCYETTLSPLWRRVARLSHRAADRLIANSRAALEEEARAGFPRERLVHVPNGLRLTEVATVARAALGLPEGPLVLTLGQLDPVKGHRHLLAAWPEVQRQHPRARLALIGEGPLRGELEASAHGLGVSFLGFRSPATAHLAACDVFVQPSLSEGLPNSVLEAMAQSRAVVGSRVGGIPELVEHGQTGLLVPPADPGALAAALGELLGDPELRARLGAEGRRRVEQHYSVEAMVGATARVWLEVLGERASASAPNSSGPTVVP